MAPEDLQPGMTLTNAPCDTPLWCTVTRVVRTRWRQRVTRFWVRWDGADADAEHTPEDARYLTPVQ